MIALGFFLHISAKFALAFCILSALVDAMSDTFLCALLTLSALDRALDGVRGLIGFCAVDSANS
jgi:hypothetical protein